MEQSLEGLKVMIIDDSKTIRRTAETLLQKEGCEVITAEDGFDALAKIADHKPQIIFVDVMMPRLDGYQTCALIKNNSEFRSTPVIMLSSKDGLFDKAKGGAGVQPAPKIQGDKGKLWNPRNDPSWRPKAKP
jgi:twitching motility two-component system response regulator PilG